MTKMHVPARTALASTRSPSHHSLPNDRTRANVVEGVIIPEARVETKTESEDYRALMAMGNGQHERQIKIRATVSLNLMREWSVVVVEIVCVRRGITVLREVARQG